MVMDRVGVGVRFTPLLIVVVVVVVLSLML